MNYVFTNMFCIALLFSALGVIYSKNALHSILFLVSTFFFSSMTVFLLENEFLALFLLIIYVGAIMVLFLFVVMMMDLKHNILKVSRLHFLTGAAFMVVSVQFFWFQISAMFCFADYNKETSLLQPNKNWFSCLDQTQDITAISSVFYHNYAAQIFTQPDVPLTHLIGPRLQTACHAANKSAAGINPFSPEDFTLLSDLTYE